MNRQQRAKLLGTRSEGENDAAGEQALQPDAAPGEATADTKAEDGDEADCKKSSDEYAIKRPDGSLVRFRRPPRDRSTSWGSTRR